MSSDHSELDEFLDELVDRVDECAGTLFEGASGIDLWFHTSQQITAWIRDAQQAWHSGQYAELPADAISDRGVGAVTSDAETKELLDSSCHICVGSGVIEDFDGNRPCHGWVHNPEVWVSGEGVQAP